MIPKDLLERSYVREKRSMHDIARTLKCSQNRVQYWLKRHGIQGRSRSDAAYAKHNPDGDPFSLKRRLGKHDLLLMGLGLGLWWGEGYKKHQKTIRLGNTDPDLIKAFIAFLTRICGMRPERIRYGLQVFSDIRPNHARRWWSGCLKVPPSQFLPKVVVTPARGVGTYKQKTRHGVLTVYCSNVKLRKVMDTLLQKYAKSLIRP
jgi:hypothetical protein